MSLPNNFRLARWLIARDVANYLAIEAFIVAKIEWSKKGSEVVKQKLYPARRYV